MALVKIKDFDQSYTDSIGESDIINYNVYSDETNEKIGTVKDILVDETTGKLRYLVVNIGFWIFGKQVLLPIGLSQVSYTEQRVYARGLTKEQAEELPEFNDELKLDTTYERQVRDIYRPAASDTLVNPVAPVAPFDPMGMNVAATLNPSSNYVPDTVSEPDNSAATPDTYDYQAEPSLYETSDKDHQSLKLYEERLVANKKRLKTGEVTVGKHVETEKTRVSVPLEKERVVIERVTPTEAGKPVTPDATDFQEGEVARIDIYKETPDIHKQAFVREEVKIKKKVEQDIIDTQETLRREELDVDTADNTVIERREQ